VKSLHSSDLTRISQSPAFQVYQEVYSRSNDAASHILHSRQICLPIVTSPPPSPIVFGLAAVGNKFARIWIERMSLVSRGNVSITTFQFCPYRSSLITPPRGRSQPPKISLSYPYITPKCQDYCCLRRKKVTVRVRIYLSQLGFAVLEYEGPQASGSASWRNLTRSVILSNS